MKVSSGLIDLRSHTFHLQMLWIYVTRFQYDRQIGVDT